jgi:hypothetical protein
MNIREASPIQDRRRGGYLSSMASRTLAGYRRGVPEHGHWREVLNSDVLEYGWVIDITLVIPTD